VPYLQRSESAALEPLVTSTGPMGGGLNPGERKGRQAVASGAATAFKANLTGLRDGAAPHSLSKGYAV